MSVPGPRVAATPAPASTHRPTVTVSAAAACARRRRDGGAHADRRAGTGRTGRTCGRHDHALACRRAGRSRTDAHQARARRLRSRHRRIPRRRRCNRPRRLVRQRPRLSPCRTDRTWRRHPCAARRRPPRHARQRSLNLNPSLRPPPGSRRYLLAARDAPARTGQRSRPGAGRHCVAARRGKRCTGSCARRYPFTVAHGPPHARVRRQRG